MLASRGLHPIFPDAETRPRKARCGSPQVRPESIHLQTSLWARSCCEPRATADPGGDPSWVARVGTGRSNPGDRARHQRWLRGLGPSTGSLSHQPLPSTLPGRLESCFQALLSVSHPCPRLASHAEPVRDPAHSPRAQGGFTPGSCLPGASRGPGAARCCSRGEAEAEGASCPLAPGISSAQSHGWHRREAPNCLPTETKMDNFYS
ncbi:uncharacterized protein LOC119512899 isoform X1 [Choloepus didactylus]|uniref:uncharacterized protein LOC119512899 isoform X1 n=1 Tax=Choloepus didactylus TaxID=27675 RepID=UPI0018A0A7FD|nr:uncharacterized protein LOC119512899 isoform X1 [Choloepus didactylus]